MLCSWGLGFIQFCGIVHTLSGQPTVRVGYSSGVPCAISPSGVMKCWGRGYWGQLGQGDTADRGGAPTDMGDALPAVQLGSGRSCVDVSMSRLHACALLDDGNVKCWGQCGGGACGYGDGITRGDNPNEMGDRLPNVDLNGETVLQVAVGEYFSCVIVTGGTVKCWGDYRLTGQGVDFDIGDHPGEMGANLPSVDLGSGRSASQIRIAEQTACALLDDASVKCWGFQTSGSYGELGYGDAAGRSWSPCHMGDNLPAVDLGPGFTPAKLAGSSGAHCVISTTGTVKCWGQAWGYDDNELRGDSPGEMGDNLPVVNFGDGLQVVDVHGSHNHMCYLFTTKQVKCVGTGEFLGYNDDTNRYNPADNLPFLDFGSRNGVPLTATSIGSGGQSWTCVVLDSNEIKCWGRNTYGSLGQGDTDARLSAGDTLPAVWLGAVFEATSTTSTSTSSTAFSVTSSTSSSTSTSTSSSMTS
eukprot:5968909-Amphidinium_carterae.1